MPLTKEQKINVLFAVLFSFKKVSHKSYNDYVAFCCYYYRNAADFRNLWLQYSFLLKLLLLYFYFVSLMSFCSAQGCRGSGGFSKVLVGPAILFYSMP
jgi:hypothetical protein